MKNSMINDQLSKQWMWDFRGLLNTEGPLNQCSWNPGRITNAISYWQDVTCFLWWATMPNAYSFCFNVRVCVLIGHVSGEVRSSRLFLAWNQQLSRSLFITFSLFYLPSAFVYWNRISLWSPVWPQTQNPPSQGSPLAGIIQCSIIAPPTVWKHLESCAYVFMRATWHLLRAQSLCGPKRYRCVEACPSLYL